MEKWIMKKAIIAMLRRLPCIAVILVYLQNLYLDDKDDWDRAEAEAKGYLDARVWPFTMAEQKLERFLSPAFNLKRPRATKVKAAPDIPDAARAADTVKEKWERHAA
jgi:hypothetical protein